MENNVNKKQQNLQPSMDTNVQPETTLTMDGQSQNEEGQALKGALGPLVNELKLLQECLDEKYAKLDEKYTKLERAISLDKSGITLEISKLEQWIVVQKVEIANEITNKIENNTEKLDKLI